MTYAYRHLSGNITTEDFSDAFVEPKLEKPEAEGPREPLNILVMGSDTREGEGNNIDNQTGEGGVGHHDPGAPLGRPEARLRHQHPARLPGHPPRLPQRGR